MRGKQHCQLIRIKTPIQPGLGENIIGHLLRPTSGPTQLNPKPCLCGLSICSFQLCEQWQKQETAAFFFLLVFFLTVWAQRGSRRSKSAVGQVVRRWTHSERRNTTGGILLNPLALELVSTITDCETWMPSWAFLQTVSYVLEGMALFWWTSLVSECEKTSVGPPAF